MNALHYDHVTVRAPAAGARIHALDVLRGFALFGMILVHFHQRMRIDVGGVQDLIAWGVYLFVEQKSWGTFAFLFGVGFAVLLRRLEARQEPIVSTYLRRLAVLAVFGVVAEAGFGFHILFTYACWGLGLLVVRHWSSRQLLATAVAAAMARPVAGAVTAVIAWSTQAGTQTGGDLALRQAVEIAAGQDSYLVLLQARWSLFTAPPGSWRAFLPDTNFALFVIGLVAVRHGIFDDPLKHVRTIRGWTIFGAVSWVLAWTVLPLIPATSIPGLQWPIAAGFGLIQDQWLCFFYIGAIVLLVARREQWALRLRPIGQAGRMALTNYMFQAVALDALGSGYGAALRLEPAVYVVAAVALFAAEVALSAFWLTRFRYGPLEWVWRVVTYWRPQALRAR